MPRVSVWLIRAAQVHLLIGFSLGAGLLVDKGYHQWPALWSWLPVHYEVLLVGWLVQLVMGVAYWIFPRFGLSPAARGREDLAWWAFGLVNAGLALAGAGLVAQQPGVLLAGRTMEVLAAVAMALNVWVRTRAAGISPM